MEYAQYIFLGSLWIFETIKQEMLRCSYNSKTIYSTINSGFLNTSENYWSIFFPDND
jgi:hypothetical protein